MSLVGPPQELHYNVETWAAGRPLYRVHGRRLGAVEFNPCLGRGGRFHPFADAAGACVPTLYGASSVEGVIAETVFHDLPFAAGQVVYEVELEERVLSKVIPARDLRLVLLAGAGLRKLGVARRDLIESPAALFPLTRRWAAALHRAAPETDGLVWVSRADDRARAAVLFGDRVGGADLAPEGGALPLIIGPGRALVEEAATRAGILIVRRA
jgi:hypothetical protein